MSGQSLTARPLRVSNLSNQGNPITKIPGKKGWDTYCVSNLSNQGNPITAGSDGETYSYRNGVSNLSNQGNPITNQVSQGVALTQATSQTSQIKAIQ